MKQKGRELSWVIKLLRTSEVEGGAVCWFEGAEAAVRGQKQAEREILRFLLHKIQYVKRVLKIKHSA